MKRQKLKAAAISLLAALFFFIGPGIAGAHFQGLLPSDDMVTQKESKDLSLALIFFHPFEGDCMNMVKPARFGVLFGGKKQNLLDTLKEKKMNGLSTWETGFQVKRPGDYIFYVEPKPYWEPAEDCFIVHYTKVIVNAFGVEEGWDEEVGLKTEIIPLTRPYGLYAGNVFQGVVKVNGKLAPYTEVEVEYYNKDGKIKASADPFVTQVVKADGNGVFTYAMPRSGWWSFAALNEDEKKIKHKGEEKSVEIGAVLWIKTHDMK